MLSPVSRRLREFRRARFAASRSVARFRVCRWTCSRSVPRAQHRSAAGHLAGSSTRGACDAVAWSAAAAASCVCAARREDSFPRRLPSRKSRRLLRSITARSASTSVSHSSSTKLGAFTYTGQAPDTMDATNVAGSLESISTRADAAPAVSAQSRRPFPWLAASAAIYFAVAIFMLMRLALGVILGRRLERESQLIDDQHALARLEFFARAAGLRSSAPRLAESELLSVPVTFGVREPAILLPAGWRDWEPAELDAVLAHEISHVARRDALAERLSLLHRAIFWFSPLSWWLARHLADLSRRSQRRCRARRRRRPHALCRNSAGIFRGSRGCARPRMVARRFHGHRRTS